MQQARKQLRVSVAAIRMARFLESWYLHRLSFRIDCPTCTTHELFEAVAGLRRGILGTTDPPASLLRRRSDREEAAELEVASFSRAELVSGPAFANWTAQSVRTRADAG